MAKRMTKAESQLIIWAIIIGLPIYGIYQFGEIIGWGWFVFWIIVIGGGYFWYQSKKEKDKQAELAKQEETRRAMIIKQQQARRAELLKKWLIRKSCG